ncbi:MAG: hypothetical protein CMN06_05560 [Roseibacillus sp.]|nr:hypothetical protein [Roseibacillus sp.]
MTGQDRSFQKLIRSTLLVTKTQHEVKRLFSGTSRPRGETCSRQKDHRGNQPEKPCTLLHNS